MENTMNTVASDEAFEMNDVSDIIIYKTHPVLMKTFYVKQKKNHFSLSDAHVIASY